MKIQIEIRDDELKSLTEYAKSLEGCKTVFGKKVTRNELIRLAVYCTALAWERPGSWEGSPMSELIEKHIDAGIYPMSEEQ